MEFFLIAPVVKVAINIFVAVIIGYYFFVKRPSDDPELKKLEDKRRSQMLWVVYAIPAIIIVAFPVFIFLYPNELDLIGDRVKNVLLYGVRILIIPLILININFYLKKRKLKIAAANQKEEHIDQ